MFKVYVVSEMAQVELKSGRVYAPAERVRFVALRGCIIGVALEDDLATVAQIAMENKF